jgi:hypothetical protein
VNRERRQTLSKSISRHTEEFGVAIRSGCRAPLPGRALAPPSVSAIPGPISRSFFPLPKRTLAPIRLRVERRRPTVYHHRRAPTQTPVCRPSGCDAALSHLSPKGWHFYLPAYMRRALGLLDADFLFTTLRGFVIFHLTFPATSKGVDWYRLERFQQLNAEQERAVIAFLQFVVTNAGNENPSYAKDAARALKRYWSLSPQERPRGLTTS